MLLKSLRSTFLWAIALSASYFLTRLWRITTLPIFTDEAIYVRWSQIAKQDANWRFISLTDGKQPLFVWLDIISLKFVNDPLLASRLVSVFAGFVALIGLYLLSCELFKKKIEGSSFKSIFSQLLNQRRVGLFTVLLFILFPFSLVMDRMAMYDSLVAATMIWSLYLEVLLVRYLRLDIALITGLVIGSAVLTKTSGFFAIYLLPFSLLLFNFKDKKGRRERFIKWLFLAITTILIAYAIYMLLRLSPFFYIIDEKNGLFVYPFSEWILHPFVNLYGNFHALLEWFFTYVTIPVVILFAAAFFIDRKKMPEKLLLLIWFLAPFVALGIFGRFLYPRFILFMTMPILVLAAYTLEFLFVKISSKIFFSIILVASLALMVWADYFIIFNFARAPIPKADLGQYINSWPAGGGVKEMIAFFDEESKKEKIYVLTQGTFGSLPTYSMEIYLGKNKNIQTRGIYPLPDLIPEDLKEKAQTMPVYVVLNDSEDPPMQWPITLVAKYQKGIGDRHLSIYRVNP